MALPDFAQVLTSTELSKVVANDSTSKMKTRLIFRKRELSYEGGYYTIALQGKFYSQSSTKVNFGVSYNVDWAIPTKQVFNKIVSPVGSKNDEDFQTTPIGGGFKPNWYGYEYNTYNLQNCPFLSSSLLTSGKVSVRQKVGDTTTNYVVNNVSPWTDESGIQGYKLTATDWVGEFYIATTGNNIGAIIFPASQTLDNSTVIVFDNIEYETTNPYVAKVAYDYTTGDSSSVTFTPLSLEDYSRDDDYETWTNLPINDMSVATVLLDPNLTVTNAQTSGRLTITPVILSGDETPVSKIWDWNETGKTIKTFPPMPYIQYPLDIFPNGNAINDSGSTEFSFRFKGEKLKAYKINFYEGQNIDDELKPIYSTNNGQLTVLDNFAYNNDYINTGTIVNIGSLRAVSEQRLFSYEIIMYADYSTSTEYTEANYVSFTSPRYYFETYETPFVSMELKGHESEEQYTSITINEKNMTIRGYYSQAQGIPLKYYSMKITDKQGIVVHQTGKIYSADINEQWDNGLSGEQYLISLFVMNEKEMSAEFDLTVTVDYKTTSTGQDALCTVDPVEQGISIKWNRGVYATAKPENEEWNYVKSFLQNEEESNLSVDVSEKEISYDNLSGEDLKINSDNFGAAFRFAAYPYTYRRDYVGEILAFDKNNPIIIPSTRSVDFESGYLAHAGSVNQLNDYIFVEGRLNLDHSADAFRFGDGDNNFYSGGIPKDPKAPIYGGSSLTVRNVTESGVQEQSFPIDSVVQKTWTFTRKDIITTYSNSRRGNIRGYTQAYMFGETSQQDFIIKRNLPMTEASANYIRENVFLYDTEQHKGYKCTDVSVNGEYFWFTFANAPEEWYIEVQDGGVAFGHTSSDNTQWSVGTAHPVSSTRWRIMWGTATYICPVVTNMYYNSQNSTMLNTGHPYGAIEQVISSTCPEFRVGELYSINDGTENTSQSYGVNFKFTEDNSESYLKTSTNIDPILYPSLFESQGTTTIQESARLQFNNPTISFASTGIEEESELGADIKIKEGARYYNVGKLYRQTSTGTTKKVALPSNPLLPIVSAASSLSLGTATNNQDMWGDYNGESFSALPYAQSVLYGTYVADKVQDSTTSLYYILKNATVTELDNAFKNATVTSLPHQSYTYAYQTSEMLTSISGLTCYHITFQQISPTAQLNVLEIYCYTNATGEYADYQGRCYMSDPYFKITNLHITHNPPTSSTMSINTLMSGITPVERTVYVKNTGVSNYDTIYQAYPIKTYQYGGQYSSANDEYLLELIIENNSGYTGLPVGSLIRIENGTEIDQCTLNYNKYYPDVNSTVTNILTTSSITLSKLNVEGTKFSLTAESFAPLPSVVFVTSSQNPQIPVGSFLTTDTTELEGVDCQNLYVTNKVNVGEIWSLATNNNKDIYSLTIEEGLLTFNVSITSDTGEVATKSITLPEIMPESKETTWAISLGVTKTNE